MSNSWKLIKKKLIELGAERGFKAEFAREMKLTPQSVQRYFDENDDTVPSFDQVEKIVRAMGFEIWQLITPPEQIRPQVPSFTAAKIHIERAMALYENLVDGLSEPTLKRLMTLRFDSISEATLNVVLDRVEEKQVKSESDQKKVRA